MGRQYHLEIGEKDYYIDLLFYHLKLRCYVVIELKNTDFMPEYAGKLNFYLSAVDDILKTDDIKDQREFCVNTMNALDTFKSVELLLMAITIVVIILVTIMMERSFIADEKKQIAILKAVGFRDSDVIRWQVIRFGILAIISVVIAMALSIPATNLAISPIFGMMGAKKVDFVYNFMSLIQYPLVIVAVTVAIAWLTALYSKTVEARDTASIE